MSILNKIKNNPRSLNLVALLVFSVFFYFLYSIITTISEDYIYNLIRFFWASIILALSVGLCYRSEQARANTRSIAFFSSLISIYLILKNEIILAVDIDYGQSMIHPVLVFTLLIVCVLVSYYLHRLKKQKVFIKSRSIKDSSLKSILVQILLFLLLAFSVFAFANYVFGNWGKPIKLSGGNESIVSVEDIRFPDLSSTQANIRAINELGLPYLRSLQYLNRSDILSKYFGKNSDIRPAFGKNEISHFLDTFGNFTFLVKGNQRKGLAQVSYRDHMQIIGKVSIGEDVVELENAVRGMPELAEEYIKRSVKLASIIGKPQVIEVHNGTLCAKFYTECTFDVQVENETSKVVVYKKKDLFVGKLEQDGTYIDLESRTSKYGNWDWPPPVAGLDMSRGLAVYALSGGRSYSHSKQKDSKRILFNLSVRGQVLNISDKTQSFFVESSKYHKHWKGHSESITAMQLPHKSNKGIIRVDLKPGESHTMDFPIKLPENFPLGWRKIKLEFTPLYTHEVNGNKIEFENLGTFITPSFDIRVVS